MSAKNWFTASDVLAFLTIPATLFDFHPGFVFGLMIGAWMMGVRVGIMSGVEVSVDVTDIDNAIERRNAIDDAE